MTVLLLINKIHNHRYEKKDLLKYQKIKKKINEYQKFIKNNFDYVGENFAYEARSIHYNNKLRDKGIYGTASNKELEELTGTNGSAYVPLPVFGTDAS